MELIITLIVLIIIWCVAFMVGAKQGANRTINQIKKDGGYYDLEYTSSAYPILAPTSSLDNDTMGTIGSKPKTQADYQREHKAEGETPAIDFMHNWIQEKSGKKQNPKQFNGIKTEEPFVKTRTKRKPKSVKENENDFDLGGSE
jgi:hypothetical protein